MKRGFPFILPTSACDKWRLNRGGIFVHLAASMLLCSVGNASAASPAELLAEVRSADSHRTHLVFKSRPVITDAQYLKALGGTPVSGIFIDEGQEEGQGWGVAVFDQPAERIWASLTHEEVMDGKLSLDVSAVVQGEPHQDGRLIFQSLDLPRPLTDRYWVTKITHGGMAYQKSGGALWELSWVDVNKEFSLQGTPFSDYEESGTPVDWTLGAWLLVPLSNETTLVEYVVSSSPGGRIPAALAARFAPGQVLQTLSSMEEIVAEQRPHPIAPGTVRPDGSSY